MEPALDVVDGDSPVPDEDWPPTEVPAVPGPPGADCSPLELALLVGLLYMVVASAAEDAGGPATSEL